MKSIHFPPPTSDDMVRAILNDRKTATRRVVKPRFRDSVFEIFRGQLCEASPDKPPRDNGDGTTTRFVRTYVPCNAPYHPGDILWVRETWRLNNPAGDFKRNSRVADLTYKADLHTEIIKITPEMEKCLSNRWNPSIHMPREAARIFLRVTDVRVERLQDMPNDGPLKEGIYFRRHPDGFTWKDNDETYCCYIDPMAAMKALYNSTIKKADRALYGWDANPWVWVIEFERINREEV